MTDRQYASWKYIEDSVLESPEISLARRNSIEAGVKPVTPGTGAFLAQFVAATAAQNIIEIGTGLGVSGLWIMQGAPNASLTTIDMEAEHQASAREVFQAAGIPTARTRLITGRAAEVLPRLNDGSYDLVLIDADSKSVPDYVEHGLRIARPGGTVAVVRVLRAGRVADPAVRDETTVAFRHLIRDAGAAEDVLSAVIPVGDGLLLLTKRA